MVRTSRTRRFPGPLPKLERAAGLQCAARSRPEPGPNGTWARRGGSAGAAVRMAARPRLRGCPEKPAEGAGPGRRGCLGTATWSCGRGPWPSGPGLPRPLAGPRPTPVAVTLPNAREGLGEGLTEDPGDPGCRPIRANHIGATSQGLQRRWGSLTSERRFLNLRGSREASAGGLPKPPPPLWAVLARTQRGAAGCGLLPNGREEVRRATLAGARAPSEGALARKLGSSAEPATASGWQRETFGARAGPSFRFSGRRVSQAGVPSEPQARGPGPGKAPHRCLV